MSTFKILVTSQKGGVGKSTVSANLAAYLRRQGQTVTLIDFDTHGSSSTWLTRAPNIGVVVQHHILPLDQGGNRPILDARLHLRRAARVAGAQVGLGGAVFLVEVTGREDKVFSGWFVVCGYIVEGV